MTRFDAETAPVDEDPGAGSPGPRRALLEAREVPLGGVRAMSVHRFLPQRDLPLVGAWCFLDRFGPQRTRMRVEPHPHIGLQTVTWPLAGEVHHRDTLGSDVVIERGALNIMTSGAGIAHSEYSVGDEPIPLDALQLWVALPEERRHGAPDFERHDDLPELDLGGGATATVVVGELAGAVSPATMHTPIVGAELRLPAGAIVDLPLETAWEYAVVPVFGSVRVEGTDEAAEAGADAETQDAVAPGALLYLGDGRRGTRLTAGDEDATVFLLGGEPFGDEIVMWWNFVGRSHDEIEAAREEWEAASDRFGHVTGHGDERIPAPPLPHVRLTPRRRRL
ncbi:redox-sensitive bicupin YhaK (pirin superfamily) [Microbacterium paludicola]|uniref:Redox-sensitive bicupin YhaK (Pirin superfamily) n=1 Tax=Microbacterium paludicola TaxID=300019 RepID=A0ABU1I2S0_9MICO|nr:MULTISPECIES: pirin family protein [Microbacterium]MDR6168194.1 redox-sensitive bicupin YhaK (pirin superfamily) [Microbacterium paludicola]